MKYVFQCAAEFASVRGTLRQLISSACPEGGELVFVALNEAVNNAFCYGCDGEHQAVEVEVMMSPSELMLRIAQHRGGICVESQSRELPDDLSDHGRGLAIMRLCVDSLEFDSSGRSCILRKYVCS